MGCYRQKHFLECYCTRLRRRRCVLSHYWKYVTTIRAEDKIMYFLFGVLIAEGPTERLLLHAYLLHKKWIPPRPQTQGTVSQTGNSSFNKKCAHQKCTTPQVAKFK